MKFYGAIGFAKTETDTHGVTREVITERNYYGDLIKNYLRLTSTDKVNSDVTINNEISIISDPYAYENFHAIRYVQFMGSKWTVDSIDVQYPRLILTVGGVYNDEQAI